MIPPTWKEKKCHFCGEENLNEFGFCNRCNIPSVFLIKKEKKSLIKLSIARWTAKIPKEQHRRCMVCGKKGIFAPKREDLSMVDKLSLYMCKELDSHKTITDTYWINDPPNNFYPALLKDDKETLHTVNKLPKCLSDLWNYADPPLLCLGCIIKYISPVKKEEKEIESEFVFEKW